MSEAEVVTVCAAGPISDEMALRLRNLRAAFAWRKPYAAIQADRLWDDISARLRLVEEQIGRTEIVRVVQFDGRPFVGLADPSSRLVEIRDRLSADLDALLALRLEYARWSPRVEDEGPTVETLTKPSRRDPVERLYEKGRLNDDQLRAAREIRVIYERVASPVRARVRRLESAGRAPRRSGRTVSEPLSDWVAERHASTYKPWAARVQDIAARQTGGARHLLAFIIDVVVEGEALDTARRRYGVGWATALEWLRFALDFYGGGAGGYVPLPSGWR